MILHHCRGKGGRQGLILHNTEAQIFTTSSSQDKDNYLRNQVIKRNGRVDSRYLPEIRTASLLIKQVQKCYILHNSLMFTQIHIFSFSLQFLVECLRVGAVLASIGN